MTRRRTDNAASVRQRLQNSARAAGRPFQEVLEYYAMERFLYRLTRSPHAGRFVLKGALMFRAWGAPTSRPVRGHVLACSCPSEIQDEPSRRTVEEQSASKQQIKSDENVRVVKHSREFRDQQIRLSQPRSTGRRRVGDAQADLVQLHGDRPGGRMGYRRGSSGYTQAFQYPGGNGRHIRACVEQSARSERRDEWPARHMQRRRRCAAQTDPYGDCKSRAGHSKRQSRHGTWGPRMRTQGSSARMGCTKKGSRRYRLNPSARAACHVS